MKRVLVLMLTGILSIGCVGCTASPDASAQDEEAASKSSREDGERFISAMRPYLNYLGEETVDGSISMPVELIEGSSKIGFCGVEGTVSHRFSSASATRVSICDWVSNIEVDDKEYDEAVESLRSFYGWDGVSGTNEATEEFDAFDYVSWDDTETDGKVTIFLDCGTLHVRWWIDDDSGSTSGTSGSTGLESSNDADDYSYRGHSSDSGSQDDDYEHLHDEDSGIYGVVGEDGDGLFAGEDFGMRLNEDGSAIATDGNGNWVMDTDGDGEVDSISIDGGNSWNEF